MGDAADPVRGDREINRAKDAKIGQDRIARRAVR
jgi:hypothetical protein